MIGRAQPDQAGKGMICTGCGEDKDVAEFSRWSRRCRDCKRAYSKEWYAKHREADPAWAVGRHLRQRKWRVDNPYQWLLTRARASAEARGLVFDIGAADLPYPLPTHCPVLGCELLYTFDSPTGQRGVGHACAASLDRIDSTKGYVPGNVAIISLRANVLKQDATIEELELLLHWLRAQLDS
jgi:hypothetical protein